MKRYALLQAGAGEQIRIIDNNTYIGKKQVEDLCMEGYEPVGYIESEQSTMKLLRGFNKNMSDKLEQRDLKLCNIRKILNDENIAQGGQVIETRQEADKVTMQGN